MFMESHDILEILKGLTPEYAVTVLSEVAEQYDLQLVDIDQT